MAFGSKDKDPKPLEARKCPFFQVGGSSTGCAKGNCVMWLDEASSCAILAAAKAAHAR